MKLLFLPMFLLVSMNLPLLGMSSGGNGFWKRIAQSTFMRARSKYPQIFDSTQLQNSNPAEKEINHFLFGGKTTYKKIHITMESAPWYQEYAKSLMAAATLSGFFVGNYTGWKARGFFTRSTPIAKITKIFPSEG